MHRDFSWSYEREIETGKQCKAVPTLRKHREFGSGGRTIGPRLFHACWGAAPIPAEHKIVF